MKLASVAIQETSEMHEESRHPQAQMIVWRDI
jgi:hypothetical protein